VIPEHFEGWDEVDENLHLGIPPGWYRLRAASYGCNRAKVRFLEISIHMLK